MTRRKPKPKPKAKARPKATPVMRVLAHEIAETDRSAAGVLQVALDVENPRLPKGGSAKALRQRAIEYGRYAAHFTGVGRRLEELSTRAFILSDLAARLKQEGNADAG